MLPLVTIVTPTYNSEQFLEQTIQSVLEQDYAFLEYIVCDGGSTDRTLEILRQYEGKLQWISERDRGQSDALNKGFRLAHGEIVAWLNADDIYQPGAISAAIRRLAMKPSAAMVYSNCDYIDGHNQFLFRQVSRPFVLAQAFVDFNLPQPTTFMRAEALKNVGYLNPELHYVMDWDLFLRLGSVYPLEYVDATWANFRIAEGTKTSSQPEQFWAEILTVFDALFARGDLPESVYAIHNQAYARAAWQAGLYYQAKTTGEAVEQGILYSQRASVAYPIFEKDLDFVRRSLTDVALRYFPDQPEDFVALIAERFCATRQARRAILGHLYATRALMKRETPPERRHVWLRRAIANDLSWLANRGIQALLWRESIRRIRRVAVPRAAP